MRRSFVSTASSLVVSLALVSSSFAVAEKTRDAGPPPGTKARYAMDVGTTTGMARMTGGMGSAMGMMFGGGGNREMRELRLRIGSTASTPASPYADHYFLPPAKLGKSVPLLIPEQQPREDAPAEFQRPKGRLILFWGCGAHAAKGQPVIIDFAKVAAGQMPPGLFSATVPVDRGPTPGNSRTYADWPNKKSGKPPAAGSSLLGAHRIASNYAPEINFDLKQDYMAGLTGKSTSVNGATILSWNSVPAATGYHAWAMGAKVDQGGGEPRDFVWWSSSASREFGGGLWDWISPAVVQRLISQKIVMPPSQTSCAIPAEVKQYAPDFLMGNLYAYGPEANFSYPPKPANAAPGWTPDWTARVRYRSFTSWMIGGPMGGMGAAMGEGNAPEQKRCKPSLMGAVLGKGC